MLELRSKKDTSVFVNPISGKATDIEEFRSVVTRGKGDNNKNRHGVTVIL